MACTSFVPKIQQRLQNKLLEPNSCFCFLQHHILLLKDLSKTIKIQNKTATQFLLNVPKVGSRLRQMDSSRVPWWFSPRQNSEIAPEFCDFFYLLVQCFKQPFMYLSETESFKGNNDTYFCWFKYSSHVLGHRFFMSDDYKNGHC